MIQESYDWIVNCIYSCQNKFHIDCCWTLIGLFEKNFKEEQETPKLIAELLSDLDTQKTSICLEA